MASLLDDETLDGARRITDEDDDLEIQELVVDDLHVVDMLGGHADVVNEVTVLESGADRSDNLMSESLDLPTAEEVVLDSAYAFDDPASSAEPDIELCTDYATSGASQGSGRKTKVGGKVRKQGAKGGGRLGAAGGTSAVVVDSGDVASQAVRKWERKQVQIKTLEGEFTVTVWATGTVLLVVVLNRSCILYEQSILLARCSTGIIPHIA